MFELISINSYYLFDFCRSSTHNTPTMAGLGRSFSHQDLSNQPITYHQPSTPHNQDPHRADRPFSSSIQRPQSKANHEPRPQTSTSRRLSFSLHDISKPWAADNTNLINGFYSVCNEEVFKDSANSALSFCHETD